MIWPSRDPLAGLESVISGLEDDLRAGCFDNLSAHQHRMGQALGGLQNLRLVPTQLRRLDVLKARASHNGKLLAAALAGMRSVAFRKTASGGFASYDAKGRSGRIGGAKPGFEQRS